MKFKRGKDPCSGELSYKPFELGTVAGIEGRVLAPFVLDYD